MKNLDSRDLSGSSSRPRSARTLAFASGACAAVALAASALASGAPATAASEPCSMFAAADVGKALGTTATASAPRTMPNGYTGCSYRLPRGRFVSIAVEELTSPADAKQNLKISADKNASFSHQPSVAIAHAGDGAFHVGSEVFVARGKRVATITVFDKPSAALAEATAVARIARP